ncbi:MAG: hypothetical protein EBW18_05885 [Burkholderiaceae bacterium]|nr:hypothetical protein [Burkholderiaceae bacterium]
MEQKQPGPGHQRTPSPSEVTRDPKVVEVYLGRDATQVQQQADAGKTGIPAGRDHA